MMHNRGPLLLIVVAVIAFVVSSAPDEADKGMYNSKGPIISPSKKEIILQNGQNFTLTCRGKWNISFKQQEISEEKIGDFNVSQRYRIHEDDELKYEVALDLTNVDRYAIGYYACHYGSVEGDVLNSLAEEPDNSESVSYIYIYVDGTGILFAPMREVVTGRSGYYIVECRPSTPDVEVTIYMASQNKTPEYLSFSPKIGYIMKTCSKNAFVCVGVQGKRDERKTIRKQKDQPQPKVTGGLKEFLAGETFSLNCTVNYTHNSALNLTWKYPNGALQGNIIEKNNNAEVKEGILYSSITVVRATKEHAGFYTCVSKNNCGEKQDHFEKKFLKKPYLKLEKYGTPPVLESAQKVIGISVGIDSYPPANFTFFRNNSEIMTTENGTYTISYEEYSMEAKLDIKMSSVEQSDLYTLFATNGYLNKSATFDVRFKAAPVVKLGNSDKKTCVLDTTTSLQCLVTGYPLPDVSWIFNMNGTETLMNSTKIIKSSNYKETAFLDVHCQYIGNITCTASNVPSKSRSKTVVNQTQRLIVYEMTNGFGIYNPGEEKTAWFSEHDDATLKCIACKYEFSSVAWSPAVDADRSTTVEYSENAYSLVAKLKIQDISLSHSGTYVCQGIAADGAVTRDHVDVNVAALAPPEITLTKSIEGEVAPFQPIEMNCLARGVPRPAVHWRKDDQILSANHSNIVIYERVVNRTTVNSTLYFSDGMKDSNQGTYECLAISGAEEFRQEDSKLARLVLKEASFLKYLIIIAIIVLVFVILIIYLTCKIKKEKQFRKEMAAAGLLYFIDGVPRSINPDLGIDEQAELLPYDERFEFPAEKLHFGKQLGAGAFGVVYKAEARGLLDAEESTPVAVKMVKKTADNMYIKALASELKIMVHLGKHINIVNLLGACTKHVGKRELIVIVEYCKFGNIHNYMQRHREVFIDQFSDTKKEKSAGAGAVNRGYDTTGSTGVQSDYGTQNTQDTDHTFLSNNTHRTSRKTSEGYVAPEWRSNYESDYSYDGRSPRPLTSRDLLAWAFQVARGMEYLAGRKVLHGDLAARNILLADDNVVKICDFGLARSIYKNDEYTKKENCLLPVKWLALECMTDRIFSTQSDVWAFGIVLWEMFSLAKTPYPNMAPQALVQFLTDGHRLHKPAYSDDRIYELMKRCWEQKPTLRPTFSQLQEILGDFLEDNVRNHYVELNAAFAEAGGARGAGHADYLAMVSAPDYNNMVTPSPHLYVNDAGAAARNFFPPTPTKLDEEGYLQMSPAITNRDTFGPKPAGTEFDFDPRKFNGRPSEASVGGSELTPMLTLNNLPRSGSDSDHEGGASPHANVCPRIEEEADEVFETKQNNAKNIQHSAVSNPTYISFDIDVRKKPVDPNSYANLAPHALVN